MMNEIENPLKDALLFEPELYTWTLDRESRGWKWVRHPNGEVCLHFRREDCDGDTQETYMSIPEMRVQLAKDKREYRKYVRPHMEAFKQWLRENPV